MKRTLALTAVALAAVLGFGGTARADHGHDRTGVSVGVGIGRGGVRFEVGIGHDRHAVRHHHRRWIGQRHHTGHVCVRTPISTQVWVEPVYDTVIVGYRPCGTPIYRRVCIRAGYHRDVVIGYRCGGCGARF